MTQLDIAVRSRIDELCDCLAESFESEGRPGGDAACRALREARIRPFRSLPSALTPEALVQRVCTQDGALSLAGIVLSCWQHFHWVHWGEEALQSDVSSHLYTAELIGPDGHLVDHTVRIGLLISEANTDYPISSHSGEETYLVISGLAEWCVGDRPYLVHPPGTLVHHPAWVPHGRRTRSEPFLGAWRWSGDLDLTSFRVEDDDTACQTAE